MKSFTKKGLAIISVLLSVFCTANAQSKFANLVELDKTVHDFGDVLTSDGPLKCKYTLTNISAKPVHIITVVSSCGCTDVTWTTEAIPPKGKGEITATFQNEDGPFPFDKTLTAYIAETTQPLILRLRGSVHQKQVPVDQNYKVKRGNLGFKDEEIKGGNMSQGQQKSGEFIVANVGKKPITVSFKNVSQFLKIDINPSTIPVGSIARISYTIDADRSLWGKNYYWFTPVVDGKEYEKMGIWAMTKEDFSDWSKEKRAAGSNILLKSNTFTFSPTSAGKKIQVEYNFSNVGKSDLQIYKVDIDNSKATLVSNPASVKPGETGKILINLDTTGMPKGEVMIMVSLTTNSPLRPLVNLFITGFIQ